MNEKIPGVPLLPPNKIHGLIKHDKFGPNS